MSTLPSCKLPGLSGASPLLERPPITTGSWLGASQWSLSCTHVRPTLPTQLPEPQLSDDSGEDEDNDDEEDCCVPRRCDDSSESSDMDSIDSTSDAEC